MKIGITGGTGFIGQVIQREAQSRGDEVIIFSRKHAGEERHFSLLNPLDTSSCEALVHLAGESILGLWTKEKRRRILESRIEGTRRLLEGIATSSAPPRILIVASAIGFYGNTGNKITDENSPAGTGFLAEVAQALENETLQALSLGIRVVLLRIGCVLGRNAGAMKLITPLFRAGLGGECGTGDQWMSCITVEDLASIALECLHDNSLSGAINAVMPEPFTNKEFTRAAALTAKTHTFVRVPSWTLRIMLGNLSSLLLDSSRIIPMRLIHKKFVYRYPTISEAMKIVFS